MSQQLLNDGLVDPVPVNVDYLIPDLSSSDDYNQWAEVLIGCNTWSGSGVVPGLESISDKAQLFFQSFFEVSRLLCELGRLPVFDMPRVVSATQDGQKFNKYLLKLEIFTEHLVSQSLYQIALTTALDLCQWMTQNSPTRDNKNKVYNTINEKLIKQLSPYVVAGKSTIPVLKVAHRLGIPFTYVGLGIYQLGWGSKGRRLDRSTCELDSAMGNKLAQNKAASANLLRAAGLPVPVHSVVTTDHDAVDRGLKIGFPVVLKPTDRDRGIGVTIDVSTEPGVKTAFAHALASSKSKQVIVERQVPGVCHRLFIANGQLLYAVKRHPMSVTGDGRRSVQNLVDDELALQGNKPPWHRSGIKPIDDLALKELEQKGLTPDAVPAAGVMVPLRRIESTEWGGVDEDVTAVVHPENQKIALQASNLFGLHISGVDIISTDISEPWFANGAIINEVNYAPLFGGGEISKSYIPAFFSSFLDGDGKIPIEVFDTMSAALAFQQQQLAQGKRCYYTDAVKTLDDSGQVLVMPLNTVKQRLRALVLRADVDAIAVVMTELK